MEHCREDMREFGIWLLESLPPHVQNKVCLACLHILQACTGCGVQHSCWCMMPS